jgi:radical SAM-linked protein
VLPWDHIDTGLKKTHLIQEWELALNGKSSPPCSERDCAECKGCSLSKFLINGFEGGENVSDLDVELPHLGKQQDEVQRYRAIFRKSNQARYLSHMDVNYAIQQAFRRAGIRVSFSRGFHPKMLISYPPALPLGMEGKSEWVEFKSLDTFSEEEFLSRINSYLIKGIEFIGLSRLDETEIPMNRNIKAFVYSVDLGDEKIVETADKLSSHDKTGESYLDQVKKCVDEYLERNRGDVLEKIFVNEIEKKLYLILNNVPRKAEKPQEIVFSVLGLKNPVFFMAREQFLLNDQMNS